MAVRPKQYQVSQTNKTKSLFQLCRQDRRERREAAEASKQEKQATAAKANARRELLNKLYKGQFVECKPGDDTDKLVQEMMNHPKNQISETTHTVNGVAKKIYAIERRAA